MFAEDTDENLKAWLSHGVTAERNVGQTLTAGNFLPNVCSVLQASATNTVTSVCTTTPLGRDLPHGPDELSECLRSRFHFCTLPRRWAATIKEKMR
jgi:hypothetical protein